MSQRVLTMNNKADHKEFLAATPHGKQSGDHAGGCDRIPGLVSVIIPAYNVERYVGAAIESVLAQTYHPIEILVVNDGSTDGTQLVLNRFGDAITVLAQENQGLASARNRGLLAARGEFIAFLDADDVWAPIKTAHEVEFLHKRPDCVFVHTQRGVIDADSNLLEADDLPVREGYCLSELVQINTVTVSSVMIRSSAIQGELFDVTAPGAEDWDYWLRLAARGPLGHINDRLTFYRVHHANMTKSYTGMIRSALRVIDLFIERETDALALDVAKQMRHKTLIAVAHLDYEQGAFAEARRRFHQAGLPMSKSDVLRYCLCCLPPFLRWSLRLVHRSLNPTRSCNQVLRPFRGKQY